MKIELSTQQAANLVNAVNGALLLVQEMRSISYMQQQALLTLSNRLDQASSDLGDAITRASSSAHQSSSLSNNE